MWEGAECDLCGGTAVNKINLTFRLSGFDKYGTGGRKDVSWERKQEKQSSASGRMQGCEVTDCMFAKKTVK